MYDSVIEFIDADDIWYNLQFGFRKHHSKYVGLALLYARTTQAQYVGKYVLGVFLDFGIAWCNLPKIFTRDIVAREIIGK